MKQASFILFIHYYSLYMIINEYTESLNTVRRHFTTVRRIYSFKRINKFILLIIHYNYLTGRTNCTIKPLIPSSRLKTAILPLCAAMTARTIANPNPYPPVSR